MIAWRTVGDLEMCLCTLSTFSKLHGKRCFTRLETIVSFDTPEKIAAWPRACVVHYQQINSHSFSRQLHRLRPIVGKSMHELSHPNVNSLYTGCETTV
jgi:hypothetical protein